MTVTLYPARKIITMNPARPHATHVAARDGTILGAGTKEELAGWGDPVIDTRFEDKVLMPGLIEGHSHMLEGALWTKSYTGFFDRMDPDGVIHAGCTDIEAVVARLAKALAKNPNAPLSAWGLDPIYFDNVRVSRADLDRVSDSIPIGIMHASGHIMNLNTPALEAAGLLKLGLNHPGIPLGADGLPTGELKGPDVMTPAGLHVGFGRDMLASDAAGMRAFGKLCVRSGVTTATDLAARLDEHAVKTMLRVIEEPRYPARIVCHRFHHGVTPQELIAQVEDLRDRSTDMCRMGRIKVIMDGSIQGFSARLRTPGYYNGAPNGLWYITPEHLEVILREAFARDLQVHTHTNGDEATQLLIETMTTILSDRPAIDHRLTVQHCQLADRAQLARLAKLGACVNFFANHHYYWGDEHYRLTVGPERAERMNAARTALDLGLTVGIHSDAPITPLGPLFTAWAAETRITASGRVQGGHECISRAEALWAITMGAAYTLKIEQDVGSIEAGKRADFAVLDADPETADDLRDISVWGTVQGGRVFEAAAL
ncbi:amidohydrolase [Roseobacter sp. MH60115]|uniref:amidohydrolase n=1 Tax=Roseobacter sp. MH60115 TaxID=2785324 RepID=UPI0018A2772E|nr:amidohydrolase [Roseobacter sp. MH60115]